MRAALLSFLPSVVPGTVVREAVRSSAPIAGIRGGARGVDGARGGRPGGESTDRGNQVHHRPHSTSRLALEATEPGCRIVVLLLMDLYAERFGESIGKSNYGVF